MLKRQKQKSFWGKKGSNINTVTANRERELLLQPDRKGGTLGVLQETGTRFTTFVHGRVG